VFLEAEQSRFTYAQFDEVISRTVVSLARAGVRQHDAVAVLSSSRPEVLQVFFAAARLGATMVPLNARLAPEELSQLLSSLNPRLFISETNQARPAVSFESMATQAGGDCGVPDDVTLTDEPTVAFCGLFTSGTTGPQKLIRLTRGNFEAAASASRERLHTNAESVWLCTLPLFHVGGLAMAYRAAADGAKLLLASKFEAKTFVQTVSASGITHASLVPTMLERVLAVEQAFDVPHRLVAVLVGGGPVDASLIQRARQRHIPALQTYGMTETCSQIATEALHEADGKTAGLPLQDIRVEIRDDDQQLLAPGTVGALWVSGSTVAPQCGSWFDTGDLASIDARGRLSIRSRRVDLILSGGENIYPHEVEAAMRRVPGIDDVAVVPLADAHWGQVPVAFVVASVPMTLEACCASLEKSLARYKMPKLLLQVGALPRNSMGKVKRNQLVEMAEIEWRLKRKQ
jgi:o-succinylbenzoate---CoA ligase